MPSYGRWSCRGRGGIGISRLGSAWPWIPARWIPSGGGASWNPLDGPRDRHELPSSLFGGPVARPPPPPPPPPSPPRPTRKLPPGATGAKLIVSTPPLREVPCSESSAHTADAIESLFTNAYGWCLL